MWEYGFSDHEMVGFAIIPTFSCMHIIPFDSLSQILNKNLMPSMNKNTLRLIKHCISSYFNFSIFLFLVAIFLYLLRIQKCSAPINSHCKCATAHTVDYDNLRHFGFLYDDLHGDFSTLAVCRTLGGERCLCRPGIHHTRVRRVKWRHWAPRRPSSGRRRHPVSRPSSVDVPRRRCAVAAQPRPVYLLCSDCVPARASYALLSILPSVGCRPWSTLWPGELLRSVCHTR